MLRNLIENTWQVLTTDWCINLNYYITTLHNKVISSLFTEKIHGWVTVLRCNVCAADIKNGEGLFLVVSTQAMNEVVGENVGGCGRITSYYKCLCVHRAWSMSPSLYFKCPSASSCTLCGRLWLLLLLPPSELLPPPPPRPPPSPRVCTPQHHRRRRHQSISEHQMIVGVVVG